MTSVIREGVYSVAERRGLQTDKAADDYFLRLRDEKLAETEADQEPGPLSGPVEGAFVVQDLQQVAEARALDQSLSSEASNTLESSTGLPATS